MQCSKNPYSITTERFGRQGRQSRQNNTRYRPIILADNRLYQRTVVPRPFLVVGFPKVPHPRLGRAANFKQETADVQQYPSFAGHRVGS
jgi:hypothetical protein